MNKKTLIGVVIFFFSIIVGLIVYNCKHNCEDFLKANAINCISALMVVGVSFFIVQRQTDQRKQKDIFISLLESLKSLVDEDKSYNFSNIERVEMLMQLRKISLKIDVIKSFAKRFKIEKDVNFLEEKFKEYQSVIDNHSTDMETLRKLHNELKRPLDLISVRTFEIMLNLYN